MTGPAARKERGTVTAELALGLPLLLAVTIGLVWLLAVGAGQVRVVDGAREAARGLARGDPEPVALARATTVAGPGSQAQASYAGGAGGIGSEVTVIVTRRVAGPGGLFGFLPEVVLEAEAVAATETPP